MMLVWVFLILLWIPITVLTVYTVETQRRTKVLENDLQRLLEALERYGYIKLGRGHGYIFIGDVSTRLATVVPILSGLRDNFELLLRWMELKISKPECSHFSGIRWRDTDLASSSRFIDLVGQEITNIIESKKARKVQ